MPELPEVETIVRDLRPLLAKRRFTKIEVGKKTLRRKWSSAWEAQLLGQSVRALHRRGKWILVELDRSWMLVHLGMTGQFTVVSAKEPRASHTHLVWTLDNGQELRFRDSRRFGSVTLFSTREELDAFFVQNGLGPEPFELEPARWRNDLHATKRNLKAILLDQTIVAGVGNIYADEVLFEAKLHPCLRGNSLTIKQTEALRLAVMKILQRAIERRGSTIRDYVGGSGLKGQFQEEFSVYGRTDEPCRHCKTPIERITLAGRSSHFCPKCQAKRT